MNIFTNNRYALAGLLLAMFLAASCSHFLSITSRPMFHVINTEERRGLFDWWRFGIIVHDNFSRRMYIDRELNLAVLLCFNEHVKDDGALPYCTPHSAQFLKGTPNEFIVSRQSDILLVYSGGPNPDIVSLGGGSIEMFLHSWYEGRGLNGRQNFQDSLDDAGIKHRLP